MPTPRKIAQVAELKENFERAEIVIGTQYRGLSVTQMNELRSALRETQTEVKVVKNRLAAMAAGAVERPEIAEVVDGPTALAIGYGDPVAPAKAFKKYLENAPRGFVVTGAWIGGQIVDREGLEEFSKIPGREELLGQFAGLIQSPLRNFAALMSSAQQNFVGLVEARAKQLEEQEQG